MPHNTTPSRLVETPAGFEGTAWKWMRYSAFLLIPLVWGHVLLQDILVGVHRINLDYVALRWASIGWRIYDAALLTFAFAHGVNGLRQVLGDFITSPGKRALLNWILLIFWALVSVIGAVALIGGVRPQ
jgi:succinate dehydrogenase / fumarate reductase membrane anchor subunit